MDKNTKDIFKRLQECKIYIMEGPRNNEAEKVRVKVSDLIKKFKTKQDIIDYCRENSKIYF